MAQIGHIIEGIFQPGRKYEDYVQKYEGYVGSAGRLVSNKEYDSLRTYAAAAGANTQISFVLPTWSPRFHLAVARQVFAEMRAAHDRLYNILDAFLTFANSISVAQAQMGVMQEDSVAKRAERQIDVLARIKAARGDQRTNVRNAIRSAEELLQKYSRDPFSGPAQDRTSQIYYDSYAERVRYLDLQNQSDALNIADLYDELSITGLNAETQRDFVEFALVGMTVQNLQEREVLLGFDFTVRIVNALTDVFQNAAEVARVVSAFWGLDRLERLAPNYRVGRLIGWYFPLAQSLWPTWGGYPINEIAERLIGDSLLAYLDKADVVLSVFERRLQEFDANATRTLFQVKVAFTSDADGVSRGVLNIPAAYRFQEVNAVYLKGMPSDVPTVEARVKDVHVTILTGADGYLHCDAELQDPEYGGMTFGSDGGMSGEEPIFAIERDCLACASAGNQPITFACRSASSANFAIDCIVRLAGFNNPGS